MVGNYPISKLKQKNNITALKLMVENPSLVYNEGVTRVFLYTEGEKIKGDEEGHEKAIAKLSNK